MVIVISNKEQAIKPIIPSNVIKSKVKHYKPLTNTKVNDIQDTHPILIKYKNYLETYHNTNTQRTYYSLIRKMLSDIEEKTNTSFSEVNQELVDLLLHHVNKIKKGETTNNTNSAVKGAVKQLIIMEDPYDKKFTLPKRVGKSRQRTKAQTYDYLDDKTIRKLIEDSDKLDRQVSIMIHLQYMSSCRINDLISFDLNKKECMIDYDKRIFTNVGKSNKENLWSFDPECAVRIKEWVASDNCIDKTRPFLIWSENKGEPCKNQKGSYDHRLKKISDKLNLLLPNGKKLHSHIFRHSRSRYLGSKGYTPQDIMVKNNQSDLRSTQKYLVLPVEEVKAKEDKIEYGL